MPKQLSTENIQNNGNLLPNPAINVIHSTALQLCMMNTTLMMPIVAATTGNSLTEILL